MDNYTIHRQIKETANKDISREISRQLKPNSKILLVINEFRRLKIYSYFFQGNLYYFIITINLW